MRAQFKCRCNRRNVANMLHMLGKDEVDGVIAELGKVDVNCDFCNKHYAFDALDVAALFASNVADINSDLGHQLLAALQFLGQNPTFDKTQLNEVWR